MAAPLPKQHPRKHLYIMHSGTDAAQDSFATVNRNHHRWSCALARAVCGLLFAVVPSVGLSADSVLLQTNWVDTSVTNVVEVRIPKNVFVTEFRTNWIDQFFTNVVTIYNTNRSTRFETNLVVVDLCRTNVIDSYKTNWTTKYQTNNHSVARVQTNTVNVYHTNWIGKELTNDLLVNRYLTNVIDRYHTNVVTRNVTNEIVINLPETNIVDTYKTNWSTKYLTNEIAINLLETNFVETFHTNWATKHLTNELAVNLVRTNFVDLYRTNLKTLNFTNWQTVIVMKTNWVTQPVTNTVQIDLPQSQNPATASSAELALSSPGEEPVIDVSRTPRSSANNSYEITLKIKWSTPASGQVQHWWIEREDGAYLSVSQDREFKRELPSGNYRVEAKVQRDPDSAVLTLRGTMVISARDVVVHQKPASKKLAAN